jgi:hypothetical protein
MTHGRPFVGLCVYNAGSLAMYKCVGGGVCVRKLATLSVYCCLEGLYTGTLHNIVLQVVPVNICCYEERLFIVGRLTIVYFETSTVVM